MARQNAASRDARQTARKRRTIRLPAAGHVHADAMRELFPRSAVLRAADGQRVDRVDADRDADVAAFRTASDHRIEADPAKAWNVGFRPAMNAGPISPVFDKEMADCDPRRHAETSRACNEHMREVARVSLSSRECLDRTGKLVFAASRVVEPFVQPVHKCVRARKRRSLISSGLACEVV
jgi:hypothetical protein